MDYQYTVYFEPLAEGGYQVVFPSIPEIVTFGRSLDEAREMARDALRCHLEGLMQDGEPLPIESRTLEGAPVKETLAITV
jgi:predicted RNA binding protein YcfA (HicA-like mRNA interferase family)/predicted RNase H-like HicB family nuclease